MKGKEKKGNGVLKRWRKSLTRTAREEFIGLLRFVLGLTAIIQLWVSFGQ